MKKSIVLCADDYGQALPISQGILSLLENSRLSAVSCIVNQPDWGKHATWIAPFKSKADIGLHFNLTEGKPLSPLYNAIHGSVFYPLSTVIRRVLLRQFDREVLKAELNAQLDRFIDVLGVAPDFIDGHQHVHQFPLIRDILMKVYLSRFPEKKPFLRSVYHTYLLGSGGLKKFVLQALGAGNFRRELKVRKIPHNTSFSGMYDFNKPIDDYSALFKRFMSEVSDHGLIMCHPAMPIKGGLDTLSVSGDDAITAARHAEYQYLASSQFLADCEEMGVVLSPFLALSRT